MKKLVICLLVGWLIAVVYMNIAAGPSISFGTSVGGPIEIARSSNEEYYRQLGLNIFIYGFLEPCAIGLLAYGFLRWRHPMYTAPVVQSLVLPVLVWWGWAALGVAGHPKNCNCDAQYYYIVATSLIGIVLAIAAARAGYYRGRIPRYSGEEDELA